MQPYRSVLNLQQAQGLAVAQVRSWEQAGCAVCNRNRRCRWQIRQHRYAAAGYQPPCDLRQYGTSFPRGGSSRRRAAFGRVLKSILPLWELVEVFCRLELLCVLLLITLRLGQPISCVGLRPSGSHKLWAPGAWGVARRDWLRTDGKPRICSWPSLCTPANKAQLSLQCTQLTKLLSASHQPVRYQLSKNSTYTVNIQLTRNVNTKLIVQIYVES